ncbi:MarR family transcriptional regulator [Clostridium estertheticum]|uniref:MarR family winged helix-turn-helix transcriptional regulator n=1 Tax=Clostridium estertheticum TaxID=238834 RepID=UPI0013E8F93F|nr:MarR family transcriptional regulator [Clostridium estertheticum]MBZ9687151.1 MarR family transcriptional regulator [Clostridium estertheticum]
MDITKRHISKICRVSHRYASLRLQGTNIGTSEYECLHYISKNTGISQENLRSFLNIDKSAVARMVANLEEKGYLYRLQDENDKRSKNLFITDKAIHVKNKSSSVESFFYEWLLEDINEEEKKIFLKVLNDLYIKSKKERVEGFINIKKRDVNFYGKAND